MPEMIVDHWETSPVMTVYVRSWMQEIPDATGFFRRDRPAVMVNSHTASEGVKRNRNSFRNTFLQLHQQMSLQVGRSVMMLTCI